MFFIIPIAFIIAMWAAESIESMSYELYCYKVLALRPPATLHEIKIAYRELAKKFHPDLNKSSGAEQKFREVQRAYEFLRRIKESKKNYSKAA